MVDFLSTSLSGLRAFQQALATTSNNVANVGTEGFVRQRVDLAATRSSFLGGNFIGTGVLVSDIKRVFNGFLVAEVRGNQSDQGRLETLVGLGSRTGDLLGSQSGGLSPGLQRFSGSMQSLATDPTSTPVRQSLLTDTRSIVDRFNSLGNRLEELDRETVSRMRSSTETITQIASAIAGINQRINDSPGAANGKFPAELLDERDRLLSRLAQEIDIDVVEQDFGQINVSIGNGQNLVLGTQAATMSVEDGRFGRGDPQIRLDGAIVTNQVSGGKLGGLVDYRQQVLTPTRNDIGRMAVAMAQAYNTQNRQGMDLQGNLGGDIFSIGAPLVGGALANTGNAELSVSITDPSALSGDDYRVRFDGTEWTLFSLSSGAALATSATGEFSIDGLEIDVASGTAAAGDDFRIQPTRGLATSLGVAIQRPEQFAAAFPLAINADIDNLGTGTISDGEILDIDNPDFLEPVTIEFINPGAFLVNGSGPFGYVDGDNIDINGWRVQISGSPAAGDTFTINPTAAGSGDNRNALALAGLRDEGLLDGGQRSLLDQADALLAEVGGTTAAAQTALSSTEAQLTAARNAVESVSGVNLEEEAANLIRFQQAYEANARVIQTANTIFQSLLQAVGR